MYMAKVGLNKPEKQLKKFLKNEGDSSNNGKSIVTFSSSLCQPTYIDELLFWCCPLSAEALIS